MADKYQYLSTGESNLCLRRNMRTGAESYVIRYTPPGARGSKYETIGSTEKFKKKEAVEIKTKFMVDLRDRGVEFLYNLSLKKQKITLVEVLEAGLRKAKEQNQTSTVETKQYLHATLLRYLPKDVNQLNEMAIRRFKKDRRASSVKGNALKNTTLDRELSALNSAIEAAIEENILPPTFTFRAALSGEMNIRDEYCTEEEVLSLFEAVDEFSYLEIWLHAIYLQGMRHREPFQYERALFDFMKDRYIVKTKDTRGKEKYQVLHPEFKAYLLRLFAHYDEIKPQLQKRRKELIRRGHLTQAESRELITVTNRLQAIESKWLISIDGRQLKCVKKAFASLVKKAGIGWNVTPHTLKHSFVTHVWNNGGDPVKTGAVSPAMMKVYAKLKDQTATRELSLVSVKKKPSKVVKFKRKEN